MEPQELAHELELIYGDDLKSVVLYGSAAGGDHSKKFSDYNCFCVLKDTSPMMMARANKVVRKWIKKGNPPLHFFGTEHIGRSLDVFPIEFLDMMDRHKVLLGKDPLEGIMVDTKNLRHQCESELKGKLIHLRAFYAANCHDAKAVAKMMVESFPTFLAAFRALLRLDGATPPREARAVVENVATIVGFEPDIFFEIIDIREGKELLPRKDAVHLAFEKFAKELEIVTEYVDKKVL